MNQYTPDNWVILEIKIVKPTKKSLYKVLGGWSGGYLDGDSWRMNSGIVKVTREGDNYLFHGSSGSIYVCHKNGFGLRMNTTGIYQQLKDIYGEVVVLMDEDTDWINIDYPE